METERKMIDLNLSVFDDEMHEDGEGDNNNNESDNDNESAPENVESSSVQNQQQKRRRCHRHTPHQIQKLEEFFRECRLPNKKQRMELGEELGLEPLKVKFWFQNKRTQIKSKQEQQENSKLLRENERLGIENMQFREALSNARCPTCNGSTLAPGDASIDALTMENARLKGEIDRIAAIAATYVGKPVTGALDIQNRK